MSATVRRLADANARLRVSAAPDEVSASTPASATRVGLRADGRLGVHYMLNLAAGEDAADKAALIALEQTVELPRSLLTAELAERFAGRVEAVQQTGRGAHGWCCRTVWTPLARTCRSA